MDNLLKSRDINLVCTLVAIGYELVECDKTDPRKVSFTLRGKDIQEDAQRYLNDQIKVPAQKLLNTRSVLMTRIFSDA